MRLYWIKVISFYFFFITIYFQIVNDAYSQNAEKYWVFFKDKGQSLRKPVDDLTTIKNRITSRALKRRRKVLKADQLFDYADLPIREGYVNQLKKDGFVAIAESRWLNAVSIRIAPYQITKLKSYSFIEKIQKVKYYKRKPTPLPKDHAIPFSIFDPSDYQLDYGESLTQNALMHVPKVHELGINGTDVIIGMLDTGFNYDLHSAFADIIVLDEYDFIHQDQRTQNEPTEDSWQQHDHGTMVLATIGAFQEGDLIGPAYRAKYLLAKTEDNSNEDIIEEDYWIAGLEWLEKKGADIVSSSVGYNDWYTFEQLDGNTALTTYAADIAVKKGMLVVNSMGNEGNKPGSIIAPADGDSVVSVGAVTAENILSHFSSIGPTADGRIKPDVVALGNGVRTVAPNSFGKFMTSNGTSFACPLVAGVAALILSSHPELTPMQVRETLRMTADRAHDPNNEYGWGLVNALDAVLYHGMVFSNRPDIQQIEAGKKIINIKIVSINGINPDSVHIHFSVTPDSFVKYPLVPTGVVHEFGGQFALDRFDEIAYFYFSAVDSAGIRRFHPFGAPIVLFTTEGEVKDDSQIPKSFYLYPNYPNPFDILTTITYDLPSANHVLFKIYNFQGQLIRTLVNEYQLPGSYSVQWDGLNSEGRPVVDGVYEIRFCAGQFTAHRVLDLIRTTLLLQNHPNPFNTYTIIQYKLLRPGKVKLRIFNLIGQLVKVLVDDFQKIDTYKITWHGRDSKDRYVSSGVYFYELETDNIRTMKKMMILR